MKRGLIGMDFMAARGNRTEGLSFYGVAGGGVTVGVGVRSGSAVRVATIASKSKGFCASDGGGSSIKSPPSGFSTLV